MSGLVGWKRDADGWLWRRSRPHDPKIGKRCDIGFDDSTFPSSAPERLVYVREEEDALAIDAGRVPEPRTHQKHMFPETARALHTEESDR